MSKVFNPISGNFISEETKLGQVLLFIQNIKDPNYIKQLLNKCKSQQVWNPVTKKCVKATTKDGKAILAAYEYYIENEPEEYVEKIKKVKGNTCDNYPQRTKEFIPRSNQKDTLDFFIKHYEETKGILLFWELGLGKSCGSALLLDYILSLGIERDIYILTSAGTRENFKSEYCSVCGNYPDQLKNFKFISYNYSMIGNSLVDLFDLTRIDNAVFVIDEFHNFVSGYINESSNYSKLFELLASSKDAKFILMTGTPLLDRIKELFVTLTLLLPNKITNYDTFKNSFTINELDQLIPPDDLKNILKLVISRYKTNLEDFPRVNYLKITVPMSTYQYDQYRSERASELSVTKPDKKLMVTDLKRYTNQKTRYFLAKIMLKSQGACNCVYPSYSKDKEDKLVEDGGWIDDMFIKNILLYSPKIYVIIELLFKYQGKFIIFTRYVKKHGLELIAAVLKYFRINYLVFSGESSSDEKRQDIISKFNSENNIYGEQYRVLIYTKAGSEGLNLFQTRFVIPFEQYIRTYLLKQAAGRAIRLLSHHLLPEDMRDVTLIELFSVTPGDNILFEDVKENRKTSDFFAYEQAIQKQFRIQPVIDMLENIESF